MITNYEIRIRFFKNKQIEIKAYKITFLKKYNFIFTIHLQN